MHAKEVHRESVQLLGHHTAMPLQERTANLLSSLPEAACGVCCSSAHVIGLYIAAGSSEACVHMHSVHADHHHVYLNLLMLMLAGPRLKQLGPGSIHHGPV